MSVRLGPVRPQRHLLLSLRRPLILKKWNWHLWCDGRARVATLNRNNKSPVRTRRARLHRLSSRGYFGGVVLDPSLVVECSVFWSSWDRSARDRGWKGLRRGQPTLNWIFKRHPKCLYIYLVVLSITFSFLFFSTFLSIVAGKTPYQDSSLWVSLGSRRRRRPLTLANLSPFPHFQTKFFKKK